MSEALKTAIDFVIFTVLVKYVIGRWLAEWFVKIFKKVFVKSQRETAIWLHYRNRALHKGHRHKTPLECEDGGCVLI